MRHDPLLPRARLRDVIRGRAPLIGSRLDAGARRGWLSPVEARFAAGIPYGDLQHEERCYLAQRSLWRDLGLLLRSCIALLLAPRASSHAQRPFIVSSRVDNLSVSEALDWVFAGGRPASARFGFFVHPHALNVAAFDAELRSVLAQADVVFPDGVGLRLGSRLLGVPLTHNVNGTDLMPLLCQRAARSGAPLVLVGAAPGVADECARRLRADHPGLQIPLVSDGYLDDAQARSLALQINRLESPVVLVGMGTPRQERWARTFLGSASKATVLTVGGLFDFYSGRVPRAPLAWRELGLEWLYRLYREPRRLARRYLLGNPLFLSLVLAQRLALWRPR